MYTLLMLLELTGEVWGWGNVGQGGPIFSAVARLTFFELSASFFSGGFSYAYARSMLARFGWKTVIDFLLWIFTIIAVVAPRRFGP